MLPFPLSFRYHFLTVPHFPLIPSVFFCESSSGFYLGCCRGVSSVGAALYDLLAIIWEIYTSLPLHFTPYTLHSPKGRTSADVEQELTRLILKAQNAHEEIILEVTDFRPGTEYGYNTPCPPELQKP